MKSLTFSILLLFPFLVFGQNSFPSAQNLQLQHWYNMGNYLQLNWDTPDTSQTIAQLVGYKVFRNFEVCDTIPSTSIDYLEYEPPFINGFIYYYLTAIYINPTGESIPTDTVYSQGPFLNIENKFSELPRNAQLLYNYPNPFNPITTIEYYIQHQSTVKISVFDILGKNIETLVYEEKISGKHTIKFNGSKFPSGLYYYQLLFGNHSIVKSMILLK